MKCLDYSFNADVAKKYGVNEAIFLQNLYFWIFKNMANGRYDFDGKNWTYNSMEAFAQLFPFWTVAQIRNIIKKLETNGAIYIGNYNIDWSNRTKWYALSEEVLELYNGINSDLLKVANAFDRNSKCQLSELANDICQKQQMSSDRNSKCYKEQIVNTDSKQQIVNTDIGAALFSEFWKAYPKREAKATAQKAFERYKPDRALLARMVSAIAAQKQSKQWTKEGGQFIPLPATWLNQRRWEDESAECTFDASFNLADIEAIINKNDKLASEPEFAE